MKASAISRIFSQSTSQEFAVCDNEGLGIAYFNLNGAIIESNRYFENFIGSEDSEIAKGNHFKNLFQFSFESESATNMFWYKVLDGLPQATEVKIVFNGCVNKLQVFLTSVTDPQSFVTGIVGFFARVGNQQNIEQWLEQGKQTHNPFHDFGWRREKSKKILVVKDFAGLNESLKSALSLLDFQFVASAGSCVEAVDKCSIIKPDVVFLDYQIISGEDGIELASFLKKTGVESIFFTSILFEDLQLPTSKSDLLKPKHVKKLENFLLNRE